MSRELRPGSIAVLWKEIDRASGETRWHCTSPMDPRYLATLPLIEGWVGTWRGPNGERGTLTPIPPEDMYVCPELVERRDRRLRQALENPPSTAD